VDEMAMTLQDFVALTEPIYQRNALLNVGSGVFNALNSYNASRIQANAGEDALNTLLRMNDQTRQDFAPWREAGVNALARQTALATPGRPFDRNMLDPGYDFRLGEQQKALDRQAAAAGRFFSGRHFKDTLRLGQDFAANEFNNVFNRYSGISGNGQIAAGAPGAMAAENKLGERISNIYGGIGNVRGSGYVGSANALLKGFGGALDQYSEWEMLNRMARGG
jgi:hypothetical protein